MRVGVDVEKVKGRGTYTVGGGPCVGHRHVDLRTKVWERGYAWMSLMKLIESAK